MNTIHLLVGPKGSGKTYIGRLLERIYDVPFIPVETIFSDVRNGRDVHDPSYHEQGLHALVQALDDVDGDTAIIESTGASPFFDRLLKELERRYTVKKYGILAPDAIMRTRRSDRTSEDEDEVERINRLSRATVENLPFVFHNVGRSDEEIVEWFSGRF